MMLLEQKNPSDALLTGTRMGLRTAAKQVSIVVAAGAVAMPATGEILVNRGAGVFSARVDEGTRGSLSTETSAGEVAEKNQGSQVMELRRRSGLTWDQLGNLFDVDRRSVHFWASGKPMNASHREKLGRILALVRRFPEDSYTVCRWLLSPDENNRLPFDLLREGQYDQLVVPELETRPIQRPEVSPEVLRARAPRPPDELVGALNDRVHIEMKGARPVRSVRLKK
jgi:DNA-binding transcriptional regulator YiaG